MSSPDLDQTTLSTGRTVKVGDTVRLNRIMAHMEPTATITRIAADPGWEKVRLHVTLESGEETTCGRDTCR